MRLFPLKVSSFLALSLLISLSTPAQTLDQKGLKKHITYLASDELKGRGTSTEEEKKAADYIARYFDQLKLQPKGTEGMLYPFIFHKSTNPHDTSNAMAPERKGYDVVGYLDNGAPTTIVIGAHYDHLGLGHDHNSLDANPEGKIHNGADDNASGTAGVLELARYFSSNKVKERHNFLFICFSGEELGLLGSKKWCDQPTIPLNSIDYMINMDMIGRLNDSTKKLMIYGVGTSPSWIPMLENLKGDFHLKTDSAGMGPSDQTSFYLKDIPVLHFFTGQHSDYHKPSDDADKINYKGEVEVLAYIVRLIEASNDQPRFVFTKTRNPDTGKSSFKVTMGVMPDYAFEGKGMRIDGVSDNKPAFRAGILKGDIVIEMGGTIVENVQDYMKVLNTYNKGDSAPLKVMREGKEIVLTVTF